MKQSLAHIALVVFEDLYGNLWDLIEFTEGHPMRL